jgi:hypothetical protein
MLHALLFSCLTAATGDSYAIELQLKNSAEFVTLEDGERFRRVERVSKKHLRTSLTLRAVGLSNGRVRIDADTFGAKPVHVAVVTKLDRMTTIGDVKVRVHKLPETVAELYMTDLVNP